MVVQYYIADLHIQIGRSSCEAARRSHVGTYKVISMWFSLFGCLWFFFSPDQLTNCAGESCTLNM